MYIFSARHLEQEEFAFWQQFDSEDQEAIIKMIDAMIVKRRVEGAVQPIDQKANGGD